MNRLKNIYIKLSNSIEKDGCDAKNIKRNFHMPDHCASDWADVDSNSIGVSYSAHRIIPTWMNRSKNNY